jgi:ankyrin repeat protein
MRPTYLARLVIVLLVAGVRLAAAAPASPVVEAVKTGDIKAIQAAIARADVNVPEADGTTALHWAVKRGDADSVDLLLKAGAKVDPTTRYGVTPLYMAARRGDAGLIDRLVKAGANPKGAMPDGETALMTAALSGIPEAVKVLAAHGAEVNATDPVRGQTALMWAASANKAAVVKMLIELGADLKLKSKPAAAAEGRRQRGQSGGYSAFLYAVRSGAIDAARALLDAGADVNETTPDQTSALVLSTINANYELSSMLLDRGANANAAGQGWTALHELTFAPHANTGGNLPGANPSGKMGYLELAKKLVEHGADINARMTKEATIPGRQLMNRIGATPFLLAAKVADVPLMKVFMELGADPMLTNVEEDTPLMAACGVGMSGVGENAGSNEEAIEAVKYILSLGPEVARVNAVSTIGNTALHGAVIRGSLPLIQMLSDLGIKLDVRNKPDKRYTGGAGYANILGGWTPLEMADGVIYQDTWKQDPDAAKLIRKLLADRGLPVPPPVYVNHLTGLAEVRRVGEDTGGTREVIETGLGKVDEKENVDRRRLKPEPPAAKKVVPPPDKKVEPTAETKKPKPQP